MAGLDAPLSGGGAELTPSRTRAAPAPAAGDPGRGRHSARNTPAVAPAGASRHPFAGPAPRMTTDRPYSGPGIKSSAGSRPVRDTCDRVPWPERGELRMDGPTDEVRKEYEAFTGGTEKARAKSGARPAPGPKAAAGT